MTANNDKAKKITDAALALFADRGYEMTKMPMIAEKAGVGTGTIYRYFTNKRELLNALYQSCMQDLLAALQDGYPYHTSIHEQFNHMYQNGVAFLKQDTRISYFISKHNFNPDLDDKSVAAQQQVLDFIRAFVEKGQKEGSLKQINPDVFIALLYGSLTFIMDFILHTDAKKDQFERSFNELREASWDAFQNNSFGKERN
ncbi:hypothetical protein IV38_GL000578 [Lactobacillus selangorensis]|uniref:HTH tetR-type domain-containing protein n=1 Tax=Lactobacillus selangorensis TaxID=81857 RepID=A0A0R2FPV7_9LACO|nr:TetR/AcrR family transcriptional regulator [Lactobacillus selangorensis]KRN29691.1 hypothetical protein IV38_GL000578 [Lactobacillus selangorensis]KRN33780.1 hypothetical protein IV40_GL000090 [Lactobacillus selangorensis]